MKTLLCFLILCSPAFAQLNWEPEINVRPRVRVEPQIVEGQQQFQQPIYGQQQQPIYGQPMQFVQQQPAPQIYLLQIAQQRQEREWQWRLYFVPRRGLLGRVTWEPLCLPQ